MSIENKQVVVEPSSERIRSLWEIMKDLDVADFMQLHTSMHIYNNMGKLPEPPSIFRVFSKSLRNIKYEKDRIPEEERSAYGKFYKHFQDECRELDMTACVATLQKIRACLVKSDSRYGDLWSYGLELQGRLQDEMKGRFYLSLNSAEADMYFNYREKWAEVITRFPAAEDDIDEAGKCFALGRYPAAVFHSLQIIEVGLIELGRILVIKDPHPGWGATTNRMKVILKAKYGDRTPFQQQHSGFIEQLDATTESLKSAWRNKVSHAHGKLALLTSSFAPDVAEEILFTSRAFMRRLATEAPTSADPDA